MLSAAGKLWRGGWDLFPVQGFHFDHPLVVLQSDDWGRAGLRDREGLDGLRAAGLALGERPYDLYTLETADDLTALQAVLNRHRDSTGRAACMEMNFMGANLDLAKMKARDFQQVYLLPLAEGLPQGWKRPGLLEAYRAGIESGVFHPALHGVTHFCRAAVERQLSAGGERALLLRTLWQAGTPYIHWRMPWIGYEYWDPEKSVADRFLPAVVQQELIGYAVRLFRKMFGKLSLSACAPGYRGNGDTHRAWARCGIRVAQNGPGTLTPPHHDRHGILHLYRNVEFEPATEPSLAGVKTSAERTSAENMFVENAVRRAGVCFDHGIPAIVSLHSINFHSSVSGFRQRTVRLLDQFLSALQSRHANLLYLDDDDLYHLVTNGFYQGSQGTTRVKVTRKRFTRGEIEQSEKAG